jgi:hypothetical protein
MEFIGLKPLVMNLLKHIKLSKMDKWLIIITLGTILLSCQKSIVDKKPESLAEIIYGKWEWRESIDPLNYGDLEYHVRRQPFQIFEFYEDNTYIKITSHLSTIDSTQRANFTLNEKDSILTMNGQGFAIYGYNCDTLDLRYSDRHSPTGRKLFKID